MKNNLMLLIALCGYNIAGLAQASSSSNQTLGLSLSNAIAITFVASGTASGAALSLPFATVSDYTNGVSSSVQQLKVQSNKVFNVSVNANAANFSYSGSVSPSPVMPVTDLNIMVTANNTGGTVAGTYSSSFTNITSTASTMLSNCLNGSNQTFSVQYKAILGFSFPAGTYTANIVFTATQP